MSRSRWKILHDGEWVWARPFFNAHFEATGYCSLCKGMSCAPGWTNIKTHGFRCDKCWKPDDWIPPLFEKRGRRRRRSSASGSD